jgi:hypothetical protein
LLAGSAKEVGTLGVSYTLPCCAVMRVLGGGGALPYKLPCCAVSAALGGGCALPYVLPCPGVPKVLGGWALAHAVPG